MRISDWSSDVCSSDLRRKLRLWSVALHAPMGTRLYRRLLRPDGTLCFRAASRSDTLGHGSTCGIAAAVVRSEEHTSELQSLMRISYAVFCLKKKNTHKASTHSSTDIRTNYNYISRRQSGT